MSRRFMPAISLGLVIFISGCAQTAPSGVQTAQAIVDACEQACTAALAAGRNLDAGPCLLDPVPLNSEWVCDVAHDPRQAVDNDPNNQCSAYRSGVATRFVEVSTDCRFIRTG